MSTTKIRGLVASTVLCLLLGVCVLSSLIQLYAEPKVFWAVMVVTSVVLMGGMAFCLFKKLAVSRLKSMTLNQAIEAGAINMAISLGASSAISFPGSDVAEQVIETGKDTSIIMILPTVVETRLREVFGDMTLCFIVDVLFPMYGNDPVKLSIDRPEFDLQTTKLMHVVLSSNGLIPVST